MRRETGEESRILITAVMPVYNGERYLRETLTHFREMPIQDMELILIDDGSSDESGEICKEYEMLDRRIRYHRQENQGIAASRNRGLELARGEYVCFWDQDDIVLPSGYMTLLAGMREAQACMGMCSTRRLICGEMSDFEKLTEAVYEGEQIRRSLLYPLLFRGYDYPFTEGADYLYGSVWKCIFRTDFVRDRQIRFRSFISYEDDWLFVTHALCCARRVAASSEAGYCWRVNEGSESHRETYIPNMWERLSALDQYVAGYLKEGVENAAALAEYRKVRMCEHYVELCRNAANMRYADAMTLDERREQRRGVKEYLRRTDYKSRLTCRKHLRDSAYRKRIVLGTLRYGGAEAACAVSGVYDRLEKRLNGIRWIVRMERRSKMK